MARKRPRSFCQKRRWQIKHKHACTPHPTKSEWADYAAVEAQCGNLSGNELIRRLSLGHCGLILASLKSGINMRELISLKNNNNKNTDIQKQTLGSWGMNGGTFSPTHRKRGKSPPPPPPSSDTQISLTISRSSSTRRRWMWHWFCALFHFLVFFKFTRLFLFPFPKATFSPMHRI